MESQLQIKTNNLWDDKNNLDQIRKLFAPTLTEIEFQFFLGLGKAAGLNPFSKEIWAVKYGSGAAQVFIGRDGYRRAALSHPDYDYHQCDSVYENDGFEVVNGEIKHTYNLKDRGHIVGAYCITKRRKASRAVYVFVKFTEYNTGKSLWASKPDVMIKKVAEATGLRASFQDLLGGTYIPEEVPEEMSQSRDTQTNKLKLILKDRENDRRNINADLHSNSDVSSMDYPHIDEHCVEDDPITEDQMSQICALIEQKSLTTERVLVGLDKYQAQSLTQLTIIQAESFIRRLERI